MSESYKVLVDENQFLTFLERLGDIFPEETYLVNTAFRSKKLTDEERKFLGARNREVYLTKNLRGSDGFRVDTENAVQKMYELEVPFKALTFNKGTPEEVTLPQKAMTTFICCNPANEKKVAMEHLLASIKTMENAILASDGGVDAKNQLCHQNTDFRSERMKFTRTKFIDFDIDIGNIESLDRDKIKDFIKKFFKEAKIFVNLNGMVVSTNGGFHVLVDKNCIKGNPNAFACDLSKYLTAIENCEVEEVKFKSESCMIPCPGILQYGTWIVKWEEL